MPSKLITPLPLIGVDIDPPQSANPVIEDPIGQTIALSTGLWNYRRVPMATDRYGHVMHRMPDLSEAIPSTEATGTVAVSAFAAYDPGGTFDLWNVWFDGGKPYLAFWSPRSAYDILWYGDYGRGVLVSGTTNCAAYSIWCRSSLVRLYNASATVAYEYRIIAYRWPTPKHV